MIKLCSCVAMRESLACQAGQALHGKIILFKKDENPKSPDSMWKARQASGTVPPIIALE